MVIVETQTITCRTIASQTTHVWIAAGLNQSSSIVKTVPSTAGSYCGCRTGMRRGPSNLYQAANRATSVALFARNVLARVEHVAAETLARQVHERIGKRLTLSVPVPDL